MAIKFSLSLAFGEYELNLVPRIYRFKLRCNNLNKNTVAPLVDLPPMYTAILSHLGSESKLLELTSSCFCAKLS